MAMAGRYNNAYNINVQREIKRVIRKQEGFTLTELLVTMVLFVIAIMAAANIFTSILGPIKQQAKIAESNIEGLIGLQMLKADIEQAGFGLPWNMGSATYLEAVNSGATDWDDTLFNDSTANPPRPIVFGDGGVIANPPVNSSDVLVVKATSVDISRAARRWTYITNTAAGNSSPMVWTPDTQNDNVVTGDNVITIKPVSGSRQRELVSSGGAFFTAFDTSLGGFDDAFEPVAGTSETHLLYGVNDGSSAPRMPFNRADYYVRRPGTMPTQCSTDAGTGILYKATVNHGDDPTTAAVEVAGQLRELPLLDCVREMQVVVGLDMNDDGATGTFYDQTTLISTEGATAATANATLASAEFIRNRLKEVRVYILAQEGQRDASYTSPSPIIATDPDTGTVINFDAAASGLLNFRWKVYTIVAKLYNMR
jgi:prepilin-type N-terminal cleavage/methylation domain-containing protein